VAFAQHARGIRPKWPGTPIDDACVPGENVWRRACRAALIRLEEIVSIAANPYFRAFVEYVHDVCAGAFPAAVLMDWLVRQQVAASIPAAVPAIQKASIWLWLVLFVAIFLLVVTGGFRLTYWQLNIRGDYIPRKKRMIVVKHTAFVLTLLAFFAWMFSLLPS
jgi:hypothetical protein